MGRREREVAKEGIDCVRGFSLACSVSLFLGAAEQEGKKERKKERKRNQAQAP